MTKQGLAETGLQGRKVYSLERLSRRMGSVFLQQSDELTVTDSAKLALESNAVAEFAGSSVINIVSTNTLTKRITASDGTNEESSIWFQSQANQADIENRATGTGTRSARIRATGTNADSNTGPALEAYKNGGTIGASYGFTADGLHLFNVNASTEAMRIQRTNRAVQLSGYLHPGTGSAISSGSYIFATQDGDVSLRLGSTNSTDWFEIRDSNNALVFRIGSSGLITIYNSNANATTTHYGMIPIEIPGVGTKQIELWN